MKNSYVWALTACLLASSPCTWAAKSDARPLFSLDHTSAYGVKARPIRYNGFDALHVVADPDHKGMDEGGCDNCTILLLEDIGFGDGTVEIEVAGRPQEGAPAWARGFVGVVFRVSKDVGEYEGVYLRPANSAEATQIRRNHTVQYFSYPDHPWRRLREQHPGVYESWADIEVGQWTRMRLEIEGSKAVLYLNGSNKPTLIVDDLKLGDGKRGAIGLFTEPTTDAYFRNLVVTHR